MNFPDNQRTGLLSEMAVDQLFTSWGWTVGSDRIDVGYDHFVEPSRERYRGARFLAQTKGTATRKKGPRIVAQVSKDRLRQYAISPLPVFIIRRLADGSLYWIHAQAWCRSNGSKLNGAGVAGVVIPNCNRLVDRDNFERYLDVVMERDGSSPTLLAEAQAARASYLSNLDPRLRVAVSIDSKVERYAISAAEEFGVVEGTMEFFVAGSDKASAVGGLRDHFSFGLPCELGVDRFRMAGSPLFEHIGLSEGRGGRLALGGRVRGTAGVQLVAGPKFELTSPVQAFHCLVFAGESGVALRPEGDRLFRVEVRLSQSDAAIEGNFTCSLSEQLLADRPLAQLAELADVGTWAEHALHRGAMVAVLQIPGGRVVAPVSAETFDGMRGMLQWITFLAQAHLVCRYFNSGYVLDGGEIGDREFEEVSLTYKLLRGERVAVPLQSFDFSPSGETMPGPNDEIRLVTDHVVKLGAEVVGRFELTVDLSGYIFAESPNAGVMRLVPGGDAEAFVRASP